MSQTTPELIGDVCDNLKILLINKNRKYGDSALNPIRIFSKADASEQLRVRLDDKLSRIVNQQDDDTEDTLVDLLGYIVLLLVCRKRDNPQDG